MFQREELLIGNKIELIKNKTILVLGLGGVGGYTVESLVRSGIGKLIIIDNDTIDITNLNRQIISTRDNIGNKKVDEWEKRIKLINPSCEVVKIDSFITDDNIEELFNTKIDYVVDACDTIKTKMAMIRICAHKNIKIISSMGTGNKLDPTHLSIKDIRKTTYDHLAKKLRKMIKDEHINTKIPVVSSDEECIKVSDHIGSISYVPAVAGLLITHYIINDIIGGKNE